MVVIRLQRIGKKHQPSYRLVVAEGRSKMIAPPTEDLGSYQPSIKKANLNAERVNYWISKGAQPSVTVWNLLVREGIVSGPKRRVYMKAAAVKAAPQPVAAAVAAEPAAAEKPAEGEAA
jgi:small subunit ribosomal protein S16